LGLKDFVVVVVAAAAVEIIQLEAVQSLVTFLFPYSD